MRAEILFALRSHPKEQRDVLTKITLLTTNNSNWIRTHLSGTISDIIDVAMVTSERGTSYQVFVPFIHPSVLEHLLLPGAISADRLSTIFRVFSAS